jgi:predicted nuclease of predicted toxin-antitoxin system
MRFKLDENFGMRTIGIFKNANHDIETVRQQQLHGSTDRRLFEICRKENRCLVTLDLDFADVLRFPPAESAGIAVIRLPHNPSMKMLESLVSNLLSAIKSESIKGNLWIVESSRIRIHQKNSDSEN